MEIKNYIEQKMNYSQDLNFLLLHKITKDDVLYFMPKNELTIIKYYYYDSIQEINNILSCCELRIYVIYFKI